MYTGPDLHAPRYRRPIQGTHNKRMYAYLREVVPQAAHLLDEELQAILLAISDVALQQITSVREGVELPESLGHLFIGSCPQPKKALIDYKASTELGVKVVTRNYETGELVAKIFYSNADTRYRFKHRELWGFNAARKFTRLVGKTYPERYERFLRVDPDRKNNHLFHTSTRKLVAKDQRTRQLETYDEFAFDE